MDKLNKKTFKNFINPFIYEEYEEWFEFVYLNSGLFKKRHENKKRVLEDLVEHVQMSKEDRDAEESNS